MASAVLSEEEENPGSPKIPFQCRRRSGASGLSLTREDDDDNDDGVGVTPRRSEVWC